MSNYCFLQFNAVNFVGWVRFFYAVKKSNPTYKSSEKEKREK